MSFPCFTPPTDLPRAYPASGLRGCIKGDPEDFRVDEVLGFEPDGEGPHAWLRVTKRGANTQRIARELARIAGVRPSDAAYAGLKDRHAVTTQWFSVRMDARPDPDWQALLPAEAEVLEVTRHRRKLRPGTAAGNRFEIRVTAAICDGQAMGSRCAALAARGVPNYFGAQRFGHDGANIARAWQLLAGGMRIRDRRLRGIYLSAARSMLFNRVLARRVVAGSWERALPGESLMLEGSHSIFTENDPRADIHERVARLDLHPTGPLCGRGAPPVTGVVASLEGEALEDCREWIDGLVKAGLEHGRRALRVVPGEPWAEMESPGTLRIGFTLPAGAYATMVLRELGDLDEAENPRR